MVIWFCVLVSAVGHKLWIETVFIRSDRRRWYVCIGVRLYNIFLLFFTLHVFSWNMAAETFLNFLKDMGFFIVDKRHFLVLLLWRTILTPHKSHGKFLYSNFIFPFKIWNQWNGRWFLKYATMWVLMSLWLYLALSLFHIWDCQWFLKDTDIWFWFLIWIKGLDPFDVRGVVRYWRR